ncbi:LysR family transcriptional regulator [Polymorphum gilvum]|uniref:Putative transcriptional regulator n=1 Tax=Polymorphum gilvum (strain LMG 25793 / CGMCC 1.9160 / SL003B-26A1) TaxID=991905 RepID=F2IYT9_POLGS|nr:LysR family transcriptional regulator [Polymorphum gilvum]ADZ69536.1 Putative transcriptional regulator [Polymorphum gilvum SL003B-26A1]
MHINDRQLRYFVKVAETGNMTRAAALLRVAQPALGIQIRQLEESLGVPLFDRHSRGVSMTPAGQRLHERACTILRLMEEAESEIRSFGESRRETLTFGVTPSIMRLVGSEILTAVRRDLPDVHLCLIEETSSVLEGSLQREEVDLALTYQLPAGTPLNNTPLLVEDLLLVAHPDQAPVSDVMAFSDVLDMELVLAHGRDPIRILVEEAAREMGRPVKVAYEVQSLQATQRVVLEGAAAGVLPYGTVAQELASGKLKACRIVEPHLRRTLYLARPSGRAPFANEDGIMKLMRSVVKQLALDLEDLAELCETGTEKAQAISGRTP